MKACENFGTAAVIALELSKSSIRFVEDLWSFEKIEFEVSCEPRTIRVAVLKEIIFRSFGSYLARPGHVELPDGMVPPEELERNRDDTLL